MLFRLISNPVDYEHDNGDTPSVSATSVVPRYYSQLKKAHKNRQVPEVREEDLEESFVRGIVI